MQMPLLKHAKKKQKQDIKRQAANKKVKVLFKALIKKAKEEPSQANLDAAYKAIDKAAKVFVIHDNKAARLKSSVAKVLASGVAQTSAVVKSSKKAKAAKAAKTKKVIKKAAATSKKKSTK